MQFKIKICGITSVADAIGAADAGADAIGLNFYPGSKRFIELQLARPIADAVAAVGALPIGVFVNHSSDEVRRTWAKVGLAAVQLHGDEPPQMLAELLPIPVLRVRRFDGGGVAAIAQDVSDCRDAGVMPFAVLIDSMSSGSYGGSGQTVSWPGLADHPRWLKLPLVLAGGLTPDNIAEAIRIVRPHAVDVASGVESSPGRKDAAKMRDFVAAARAAFAAL